MADNALMKKVLYIEDESEIVKIFNEELESSCQIDLSTNFKEIRSKIKNTKYDYILVDLHIGTNISGLDVLDFIDREPLDYSPEIYVFSGYTNSMEVVKEKHYSFLKNEHILRKPQGLEFLIDKLKS